MALSFLYRLIRRVVEYVRHRMDAVAKDAEILVDPARGRVTLADYANSWLDDRRLRPRTQELYEGLVRLHIVPALGEVELGRLTPSIIRRWHSRMIDVEAVGASTAAKAYRLLHAILATATVDELLARNPCVVKGAGTEHAPERPVISVTDVWAFADIMARVTGHSS